MVLELHVNQRIVPVERRSVYVETSMAEIEKRENPAVSTELQSLSAGEFKLGGVT